MNTSTHRRRVATAGGLLALLLAGLSLVAGRAAGQSIPSRTYELAFADYYDGDFADSIKDFEDEGRGAIKGANGRWIDSICYHTMLAESYYRMGNYSQSLEHHTRALQQYLQFPDWMIRVQWPGAIQPANRRLLANMRWVRPERTQVVIGNYSDSMPIKLGGQLWVGNVVLQNAKVIPINVIEIIRCMTVSLRRYHELRGPTARFDPLLGNLVTQLGQRPVPAGHWSQAFIDVMLGIATRASGNAGNAKALLTRGAVAAGQFEHPLTGYALLELGHIALLEGDFATATRMFQEAAFSAAWFMDPGGPDVIEEGLRYGFIAHYLSNRRQPYRILGDVADYAKAKRLDHLYVSLMLSTAESALSLNQINAASEAVGRAQGTIRRRDMARGNIGARLNHVLATMLYQEGKVQGGDQAIAAALNYQRAGGSLWMFQIALADNLYTTNQISDRTATTLYETVLRDPGRADWEIQPLESLSVLVTPHPLPLEHWFELEYKQKHYEKAIEITDIIRRHRFFNTLLLGGRLMSLRWLLEGPENQQIALARRDILLSYPRYSALAQQAHRIRNELAALPLVPADEEQRSAQKTRLTELAAISVQQEALLREVAVRRDLAPLLFPPIRDIKQLQKAMPEGQVSLVFFASSRYLYAFLLGKQDYAAWNVGNPRLLMKNVKTMLRAMGNLASNRQLPQAELSEQQWKDAARKVYEVMFQQTKARLSGEIRELVIVPDGPLWYLPFEALQLPDGAETQSLIITTRVRYAPTVSLTIPDGRARGEARNTAVVVGKLYPRQDEAQLEAAFGQLSRAVPGTVRLPQELPAPSAVYATQFDRLVVLDEIAAAGPLQWRPVTTSPGPMGTLDGWLSLPWGSPDEVVLPGFHTAAEHALQQEYAGGHEIFTAVCALMATGTRTVLLSRWRTGGATSLDAVREFTQELPHGAASEAWQRAVLVTMESQVNPDAEPRVLGSARDAPPKAEHPFFWSGYMLIDTGALPRKDPPAAENAAGG